MRSPTRALGSPSSRALVAGLLVALVTGVVMMVMHRARQDPLRPRAAITAALGDQQTRTALAGTHWNRVSAGAVDTRTERISFYANDQIVGEVALNRRGQVTQIKDYAGQRVPYGDWIAYQPAVLIGLSAVFALMTGVAPLRRLRNLDVAASLSLVGSVVLLQQRYVGASVIGALPGLGYLMLRCGSIAVGPVRPAAPATPLVQALTTGWDSSRRVWMLRVSLGALVSILLMIAVSSPVPVDVVYAVMEGATKLLHGVIPYGHLPGDVVHGDTYPLLTYVLYVPIALLEPVHSVWDSVDLGLAATVVAAAAGAWLLLAAGAGPRWRRRIRTAIPADEDGLRAALAWLSFPPLVIAVSSGTTDVLLAVLLLAAVLLWRRPALSSALLAAAGWFKLAPFLLLAIFLSPLRGRRLVGAWAAILAVSMPLVALLLALGGVHAPAAMIRGISFQFSRGSPQSLWAVLGLPGLQPLGEACVLGLIVAAAVRFHGTPRLADDRARMAAAAVACLIGLQLAADYWSVLYVVWVVPLLCLSTYQPTEAAQSVAVPVPATPQLQGALSG